MTDNIQRILVATDFSSCSSAALERAGYIAASLGAQLTAIHVWDYKAVYTDAMVGSGPPEAAVHKREAEAAEKMAAFTEKARAVGVTITETLMRRGSPEDEIVKAAEEGGFDLIVMGTHGREGVPRFFIGSVAEHVVRRAGCPVLTVRRDG